MFQPVVGMREDGGAFDISRDSGGELGHEGRAARGPCAKADLRGRERILETLSDRQSEKIVDRRDDDRSAGMRADRDLLRLALADVGLAASVGLQLDQKHGVDVRRRGENARLRLLGHAEGGDERGVMPGS